MALISCPECHREISDRASACPTCGCPVASRSVPPAVQVTHVRHEEVNRGFSKGIDKGMEQLGTGSLKLILSVIAIVAIIAVIAIWSNTRCTECSGTGKTWGGLATCGKCDGSGWRK